MDRGRARRADGRPAAGCGVLAAAAALACFLSSVPAGAVTVEPERATELVENVDCGWYSANHSEEYRWTKRRAGDHEPYRHSQVVYTRRPSDAWESAQGEYEGEAVKIVESWMKGGRRVAFRVWAQRHADLPEWWRSKIRKLPPEHCRKDGDLCFWDANYVEHHRRMIQALGKRWNGNAYVAWVDIGAVGNSGGEWCIHEWDSYAKAGLTREIYLELCKSIVDIYVDAFPDTQLIIACDCMETSKHHKELERYLKERRIGLRNDGLGMGPDKLCWSKQEFLDFYEVLPVIFENTVQWHDGDATTRACLDAAATAHPLFVRAGTNCVGSEEVEKLAPGILDEYGRKFGYHLRVKKARYQSPCFGSLELAMLWTNEGTSPCYVDHGLEVSLLSSSGRAIFKEVLEPNPPVPAWMPGTDVPVRVNVRLPGSRTGTFAVAVRLVHPRKDWPWPVKLEMKEHTPDWRYIIGPVEVRGGGLSSRRETAGSDSGGSPTDTSGGRGGNAADERAAARIYLMACQAEKMGQREAAKKLYQQIVSRYPETSYAEKAARRLGK